MKKTVSVLLILAALFLAASPLSVTASASAGELTLDEATNIIRNGGSSIFTLNATAFTEMSAIRRVTKTR